MKAFLVLENGEVFEGESFGYEASSVGEVVFNTSMAGYQEILTDPSYCKQIVTLTYPMVGNYGICDEDMESDKIQVSGLIVKEYVDYPSNFNSKETLREFLIRYKTPAIQGVDTRKLTRIIRSEGAQRGGIFFGESFSESFRKEVFQFPGLLGLDLAKEVSTKKAYEFGTKGKGNLQLAVYDFGIKTNILRKLNEVGFDVKVFPARTPAKELLSQGFDAFFLSNGLVTRDRLSMALRMRKRYSNPRSRYLESVWGTRF